MLSRDRGKSRVYRLCPFGYPVSGTSGCCTAHFRFSQKRSNLVERNSRSVVEIPKQFLGLKPLGGCPNKSAIRPFNSHVWKVSKWLFLAVSRRSGDKIHPWPPTKGGLRPKGVLHAFQCECLVLRRVGGPKFSRNYMSGNHMGLFKSPRRAPVPTYSYPPACLHHLE